MVYLCYGTVGKYILFKGKVWSLILNCVRTSARTCFKQETNTLFLLDSTLQQYNRINTFLNYLCRVWHYRCKKKLLVTETEFYKGFLVLCPYYWCHQYLLVL